MEFAEAIVATLKIFLALLPQDIHDPLVQILLKYKAIVGSIKRQDKRVC